MTIETSKQIIILGEVTTKAIKVLDVKGIEQATLIEEFIPDGKTIELITTEIYSDNGKVFKRKADEAMLSTHITLGTKDSIDNYDEIMLKTNVPIIGVDKDGLSLR